MNHLRPHHVTINGSILTTLAWIYKRSKRLFRRGTHVEVESWRKKNLKKSLHTYVSQIEASFNLLLVIPEAKDCKWVENVNLSIAQTVFFLFKGVSQNAFVALHVSKQELFQSADKLSRLTENFKLIWMESW